VWFAGLAIMIVSIVLNSWALALAPLAILAPLSGETVVWNVVLAVYCLGETTNPTELGAMGLILSGIVIVVIFGPHDVASPPHTGTLELEIDRFTSNPRMLFYFLCVGFIMACSVALILRTGRAKRPRLNSLGYAHLAGVVAGQTQLFLKCVVDLFDTEDWVSSGTFWLFAGITLICGLSQLFILNKGLALHPAVTYVPIYQACLSIYTGIAGGFYFEEFQSLGPWQVGLSVVGIGLTVLGLAVPLIVVSSAGSGSSSLKDEEEESEAQGMFECMSPRSQSPNKELDLLGAATGLEYIDLDLGAACIEVRDEDPRQAALRSSWGPSASVRVATMSPRSRHGREEEPAEDTPMMGAKAASASENGNRTGGESSSTYGSLS